MFVELHMIQNFSPANLNRDDTNNPKDCEFGGVRRARISSQCIKRAMRTDPVFAQTTGVDTSTRTRWISRTLCEALTAKDKPETESEAVAIRFAEAYAQKMDKNKKGRTAILAYISPDELKEITQAILDNWDTIVPETKASDKALSDITKQVLKKYEITSAPDIALFGRMLAIKPNTKILDAACQVAHAISTHRVTMEMDFFTAVDDLQERDEETGAGMMGFTGFDSACFYRYVRIDWEQLAKNLNHDADLARRTVAGLLRAAVAAVPSGKQTSFAANNPPSFLLAVVRQDGMGWSLANAFERPVRPSRDNGLVAPSVDALDAYWGQLCQVYGDGTLTCVAALALGNGLELKNLKSAQLENLEAWVSAITEALPAGEAGA
jgi:CRISPR system Cascade subunit CasC